MSDDVTADCVGGKNGHFSQMVVPFPEKSKDLGFNGAESFISRFFIEWKRVHDLNYP